MSREDESEKWLGILQRFNLNGFRKNQGFFLESNYLVYLVI